MRLFPWLILLLLPLMSQAYDTSLSPALYKNLNEIQEQLTEQNYEAVEKRLVKLEEQLKPSFGLALVYQLHGQMWLMQEQAEKGLVYFQKALALEVLAPAQEAGIATTTAQILLSLERPKEAYNVLQPRLTRILELEKEDSNASKSRVKSQASDSKPIQYIQANSFIVVATANQLQKQYKQSIPWLQQGLARTDEPKENWLLMLMVAHYQEKQYADSVSVLDELIRINPNKEDYWQQQASLYQMLEQTSKALRTLELGYAGGYVQKPDSILQLVQLLISNGIPERAGRILQKHLSDNSIELSDKHWKTLAAAWQQSREHAKAAEALLEASKHMNEGTLIFRAAQLQAQIGEYQQSTDNAKQAIQKGLKDKDESNALMLIASNAYELKDLAESRRYFQRALQYPNTASNAKNWLDYIAALEESYNL